MSIYPALRYTDPNAALDWLCAVFGFTQDEVHRDEQGVVGHAVLSLGAGKILISGARDPGWLGGGAADPLTSPISVYVVVDDPATHRKAADAATIVRELEHMDYGSDEYSARDLEGNLWSFGTYQP
jgi:uncharacterized glyoxalase superfamily protein PhnB